jgi:hypothetical protein
MRDYVRGSGLVALRGDFFGEGSNTAEPDVVDSA